MLALRKKTLGQFFPSFACFAHKKLSAESRPSAKSWLVAGMIFGVVVRIPFLHCRFLVQCGTFDLNLLPGINKSRITVTDTV